MQPLHIRLSHVSRGRDSNREICHRQMPRGTVFRLGHTFSTMITRKVTVDHLGAWSIFMHAMVSPDVGTHLCCTHLTLPGTEELDPGGTALKVPKTASVGTT